MAIANLTAEVLRQHLSYDETSGNFFRKTKTGTAKIGDIAGWIEPHGYRKISIGSRKYYAHRCAFLYMTGAWPTDDIDHIDGNPSNNAWSNLRQVPHAVNLQNLKSARKDNKTGLLGVSFHKQANKFVAYIAVDGRQFYLGLFASEQEAFDAYVAKKRELHVGGTL